MKQTMLLMATTVLLSFGLIVQGQLTLATAFGLLAGSIIGSLAYYQRNQRNER